MGSLLHDCKHCIRQYLSSLTPNTYCPVTEQESSQGGKGGPPNWQTSESIAYVLETVGKVRDGSDVCSEGPNQIEIARVLGSMGSRSLWKAYTEFCLVLQIRF